MQVKYTITLIVEEEPKNWEVEAGHLPTEIEMLDCIKTFIKENEDYVLDLAESLWTEDTDKCTITVEEVKPDVS